MFPVGHGEFVLASGRLLNLGCAARHPSFVMSCTFTVQGLAQCNPLKNLYENKGYKIQVYLLHMGPDEKFAQLHLPALGAERSVP